MSSCPQRRGVDVADPATKLAASLSATLRLGAPRPTTDWCLPVSGSLLGDVFHHLQAARRFATSGRRAARPCDRSSAPWRWWKLALGRRPFLGEGARWPAILPWRRDAGSLGGRPSMSRDGCCRQTRRTEATWNRYPIPGDPMFQGEPPGTRELDFRFLEPVPPPSGSRSSYSLGFSAVWIPRWKIRTTATAPRITHSVVAQTTPRGRAPGPLQTVVHRLCFTWPLPDVLPVLRRAFVDRSRLARTDDRRSP